MGILGNFNKKDTKSSGIFSEWLETLQQESWQLELLISGFALLGVWQSKKFINALDLFNTLHISSTALDGAMDLLILLLNISWFIFLSNLLIHIILRGFWIGAIGLRYVSGEINYEELGYSDFFTDYLRRKIGSYDSFIERLEKLCSIIFAFTFLLFFLVLSLLSYFGVMIASQALIMKVLGIDNGGRFPILILIFLGLGLIMLIDFLSFGGLKKLKPGIAAKGFSYIYRFMSLISLSFLYRPLLYNFLDDKYTRRLLLLSIPYFVFLVLIFPLTSIQTYPFFPSFENHRYESNYTSKNSVQWFYYDDLRKEFVENSTDAFKRKEVINLVSLSSFEISKDYTTMFLRQTARDIKRLENKTNSSAFFKPGLRHMFMGKQAKDSTYNALNSKIIADYREVLNFKSNNKELHSEERWDEITDSILLNNNEMRNLHQRDKIQNNLTAFKSLFSAKVDGKEILDDCLCKFYVHPNAQEKGILCYINTKELEIGPHEIRVAKRFIARGNVHIDSLVRYIPFIKNSKD